MKKIEATKGCEDCPFFGDEAGVSAGPDYCYFTGEKLQENQLVTTNCPLKKGEVLVFLPEDVKNSG
tara:strand:+ start:326 stop:523 length:198 start_codon:yes stop_codon:yes gene_type:complete